MPTKAELQAERDRLRRELEEMRPKLKRFAERSSMVARLIRLSHEGLHKKVNFESSYDETGEEQATRLTRGIQLAIERLIRIQVYCDPANAPMVDRSQVEGGQPLWDVDTGDDAQDDRDAQRRVEWFLDLVDRLEGDGEAALTIDLPPLPLGEHAIDLSPLEKNPQE